MGGSKKNQRRRNRLWHEDPHCRRCGAETVLPRMLAEQYGFEHCSNIAGRVKPWDRDRMATLEHHRSRWNAERGQDREVATTLLCWKCNNALNHVEETSQSLDDKWERAGNRSLSAMLREEFMQLAIDHEALDDPDLVDALVETTYQVLSRSKHGRARRSRVP